MNEKVNSLSHSEALPIQIAGDNVEIAVTEVSDDTVRVSVFPVKTCRVCQVFEGEVLAPREWEEPALRISKLSAPMTVILSKLTVKISLSPLTIVVEKHDGKVVQTLMINESDGTVSFPLGSGKIFGLGEGFSSQINRRGAKYDMSENGQILGTLENYGATVAIPYIVNTDGWGIYFHMPWKAQIDLTGEVGTFSVEPKQYRDIFIINVDKPIKAAVEYYGLTGKSPMPPKYALGYQQSYRTLVYNDKNEVLYTARLMRERQLPCDMLIYLGTGYCNHGWNTGHRSFTFDPVSFPNPGEMMDTLHDMGFKVMLHENNCYKELHGSIDDTDVDPSESDHAKNYWANHTELINSSMVDAWWPDDGDGLDIKARLARFRMYYEGCLKDQPNIRPYAMLRNGYSGMTRYGGIIWTGDTLSEWDTLHNSVPIGLNVSLSASPYWGTDTGGFYPTKQLTGELFIRWFQYSTFNPIFRAHGKLWKLHTPWGWSTQSLSELPDECSYGMKGCTLPLPESLPDYRVEPICKKYLELRYKLMPYIYSLAREAYDTGVPIMRPMWLQYDSDGTATSLGDQYMFGSSLLVAPVTRQGESEHNIYLPEGTWYDFWDSSTVEGGHTVTRQVDLETIPVYVPAGSIIPEGPIHQYTETSKENGGIDDVVFKIYSGADGKYALYEDDGTTLDYQSNIATWTEVEWKNDTRQVSVAGRSAVLQGKCRDFNVLILPENETRVISCVYDSL